MVTMDYVNANSTFMITWTSHILIAGCDGDVAEVVITWISDLAKFGH
jgi:hypothetical protein